MSFPPVGQRLNDSPISTVLGLIFVMFFHSGCTERSHDSEHLLARSPLFQALIVRTDSLENSASVDSYLALLQELHKYADSTGLTVDKAIISGRLGQHFLYTRGKVNSAYLYLIEQRDILESQTILDTTGLIRNYLDLSFLHVKKLELPFARSYAMMAHRLVQNLVQADSVLLSEVYLALGYVFWYGLEAERQESLGYYHLARRYLLPTRDLHRALYNKSLIGLINNFNNIPQTDSSTYYLDLYYEHNQHHKEALTEYYRLYGICHYLTKEYAESASYLQMAIALFQKQRTPDPYSSVDAYFVISAAYQYNGKFTAAMASIDSALIKRFGSVNDLNSFQTDISSIGYYAAKAEILGDSAMVKKDTALAVKTLDMYKSIDTLRRYFIKLDIDTYLHQQFFNNSTYWKPMEIDSFLYSRMRSEKWLHHIHDLIASYKAQGFNRDRILNQLYHSPVKNEQCFQDFVKNDLALEEATHGENVIQINMLLRKRQEVIHDISQKIPEVLDQLIHAKNMTSADLLQYTIDHRKAILNYYIGNPFYNKNHIYVLIAVNGSFKLKILENSAEILTLTDTLYKMHKLAALASDDLDTLEYFSVSHRLYETLFKGTAGLLDGVTDLVIIPDQKLHLLSFDGLLTNDPDLSHQNCLISDARYLVQDFNIVYAYSPNDLIDDQGASFQTFPLDILTMSYSSNETLHEVSDGVQELNSSIRELEVIKRLKGDREARYFSGYDCTKKNFMRYAPQAEIIHVSTHGVYDPEDRTSGTLYLRKGRSLDRLYQYELRYKEIKPKLLVLSACDSGAGKSNNEEGMLSIGRTFQAFGTEQAITALWPLSGNATVEFVELFYQDLFDGQDVQNALRNGKLSIIKDKKRHALPGYWGAMVLHL